MALPPGQQPPPAGKPCQRCGTQNAPAANFCLHCGTSLSGPPQPGQQPPPAKLRQRAKDLRKWLKHPLIVALITFLITLTAQWLLGPPSNSKITDLMDREIVAATTRNVALLDSIYAPQATIIDSGCSSHTQGSIWPGLALIRARYSSLPTLTGLEHFGPHITWSPDNFLATTAYATATTSGGILSANGSGSIPLGGYEHWSAAKINGQWLITSFTYSLCSLS